MKSAAFAKWNLGADDSAPPGVLFSLCVATGALVCCSLFDRDTTLAIQLPVFLLVWGATGLPTMLAFSRHWFRPRTDLTRIPHARLKQDSPGRWALAGIGGTLFIGALLALSARQCMSVAAQRISGHRVQVVANVSAIRRMYGSKRVCNRRAAFFIAGRGDVELCIQPRRGPQLMADTVRMGDRVTLVFVESALGSALVGVDAG